MRRLSFFFTVALVTFMAGYSAAAATWSGEEVPSYLAAKVQKATAECREDGWTGPAHIDRTALRGLLGAPCDRVQGCAIYALGEIRDLESVNSLVAMLGHQNPRLRRNAAHALGKIGDSRAVGPLARVMNNPAEEILVRCGSARALGKIADLKSVEALRQASRCPEARLARTARSALEGMQGLLFLGGI